jgi:malate dehydrogenase
VNEDTHPLISHINTKSKVTGHVGAAQLEEAIKDADVGKLS